MVVGDKNRRFLEKRKRLQYCGPAPGMILYGHIRFRFRWLSACSHVMRKQQEADVVEIGGQFEVMQVHGGQAGCLPDHQRDGSRAAPMARLPGEATVDFFADLPHQNTFDIAA
jgi:hypothetical protein